MHELTAALEQQSRPRKANLAGGTAWLWARAGMLARQGQGRRKCSARAAGRAVVAPRPVSNRRGAAGVPLRRRRHRSDPEPSSARLSRAFARSRRRRRRRVRVPARRPDRGEPSDAARPAAAAARRRAVDGCLHGDPRVLRHDADPAPGRAVVRRARRCRGAGRRDHQRDLGAAALAGQGSAHAAGERAGIGTGVQGNLRGGDRRRRRHGTAAGFRQPPAPRGVHPPRAGTERRDDLRRARTIGDPAASIPAIQSVVWDAAPYLAFYSVATVEQLLSDTLAARRFTTLLLALFGAAAVHPTRRRMRRPRPPSPRPKRTSLRAKHSR